MLSTESYIVLQYNLSKRLARDQYSDWVSLDQAKAVKEDMKLKKKSDTFRKLHKNEYLYALGFSATKRTKCTKGK